MSRSRRRLAAPSIRRRHQRRRRHRRRSLEPGMEVTEMRRATVLSSVIAAAAAISIGCAAVGPNYSRPQLPTPLQFRFVEGEQAASLADTPWFQVFQDPTLQTLIRDAISNNLDLKVATARVEEMRARAGIAKSFLYPQVDAVANYSVRQASNANQENGGEDTTHQ